MRPGGASRYVRALRLLLGLAAIFVVPLLIGDKTLDPTRQPKFLALQVLVFLLLCLEAFPERKRWLPRLDLFHIPLIGLGLLFLYHVFADPHLPGAYGQSEEVGVWVQHRQALRHAVQYGAFLLFAWFVGAGRFGRDWPRRSLDLLQVFVAFTAVYAIFQYKGIDPSPLVPAQAGEKFRTYATLGNPLFVADFLALGIVWIAGNFYRRRSRRWLLFSGVAIPVALVALILTSSRGAMLVLGFGVLVFFIPFVVLSLRKRPVRTLVVVLLVCLLLGGFLAGLLEYSSSARGAYRSLLDRGSQALSLGDFSALSRLILWRVCVEQWKTAPLLGVGMEQFRLRFFGTLHDLFAQNPHAANVFQGSNIIAADEAHGEYFQILAEWGLVGLGLFLLMLVTALYRLGSLSWRRGGTLPGEDRRICWLAFVSIAMLGLEFGYNFALRLPSHAIVLFSMAGLSAYYWRRSGDNGGEETPRGAGLVRRIVVLLIGIAGIAYTTSLYQGEVDTFMGRTRILEGRMDLARQRLERALALVPEKGEAAHYYSIYLQEARGDSLNALRFATRAVLTDNEPLSIIHQANILIDLQRQQLAGKILERFTELGASVPQFDYAQGLLHYMAGEFGQAAERFEAALKGDPRNYMAALYLSSACEGLKDYDRGEQAARTALMIKPRGLQAHLQMAQILEGKRDYLRAMEHLQSAKAIAWELGDREAQLEVEQRIQRLELDRMRVR